ncbi:MAG: YbaB/EbfC family nucleoid-associated protein [Bacilli bacterium]|nr:YbaB/EbfC family nucleoid-associated protein [Bacilli bacterium]
MNINQLMQQAQKMQKDINKAQEEVGKMIFTSKKDLVEVEINGNKEITKITLDKNIEKDDIEALEDMILIAVNDAIKQAEAEMEKKLGRYSKAMPGLF